MVLVDTSVWVAHLRAGENGLIGLLNNSQVLIHPFIIGELACGNFKNRAEILSLLQSLPVAAVAEHTEVMQFIEDHQLMSRGIGYVDVHLLTSVMLTGVSIWTFDKKLKAAAALFGINFKNEKTS